MPPKKPIIDDNGINFGQLDKVIRGQLDADAKYDRENDAKFRAVRQKVATYEEFENIVLGAHLKPLKENITELELKKTGWQSGRAVERTRAHDRALGSDINIIPPKDLKHPQTSQAFTREWRRLQKCKDTAEQYTFLLSTGADIATLFKTGVDNVLGEFVTVLSQGFRVDDTAQVVHVLSTLAKTPRFGLAKEFLDGKEQTAVSELLTKLTAAVETGHEALHGRIAESSKSSESAAGDDTPDFAALSIADLSRAESAHTSVGSDVAITNSAVASRVTPAAISELRSLYAI